jgi:CPA1 family monovalent cation:H+ antiporter
MASLGRVQTGPSAIILQFAGTFGVWILADRIGLSAVVTVVVYAMTVARTAPRRISAQLRIPTYAVWDTVVFVLTVLAFVLIGLQVRPILAPLERSQQFAYFRIALVLFVIVVLVRCAWIMTYITAARLKARWFGAGRWPGANTPSAKGGILVSWCGMRGVVTIAAAYALPPAFPNRDLILFCSFFIVVGTLVVQGLTLRPLILWLRLKDDGAVEREVDLAHTKMLKVALAELEGDDSREARALREELTSLLDIAERSGGRPAQDSRHDHLRVRLIKRQRESLLGMRASGEIGDDAFHQMEELLDWAELNARSPATGL